MPALPIYHGVPTLSLRGVMLFPRDLAKAEAWVGWKLAGGPLKEFLARGHSLPTGAIADIAADAASLSSYFDKAKHNEWAGSTVGAVVTALWALICREPETASWDRAIQVAENVGVEHGHRTGRSSFRAHLSEFSAVLHLLGAWEMRGRHFIVNDAVGYTAPTDAKFFVAESQVLLRKLREWSSARRTSTPELHLSAEKFEGGPEWMPPEHLADAWPKTGMIRTLALPEDSVPVRRPAGRPKMPSS
jgi:hypothetical protein